MKRGRALVAAAALAMTAHGCALTSRGASVKWQYFTPERVAARPASQVVAVKPEVVCLGHVTAGTGLGQRIAYSNGGYEVGYYEDRRWTEQPEHYVRRRLERTLFQEQGFRCDPDASGPTLNIEVLKFEEVRTPAAHGAHVALRAVLTTDRMVFDETVQAVAPVVGSSFDDVVGAIGRALDDTSAQLARKTGTALAKEGGVAPAE